MMRPQTKEKPAKTSPKAHSAGKFYDKSLAGVYEAVGGIDVFRQISLCFHSSVDADPQLRAIFPTNMDALEERLALYLAELTGGPANYSESRGKTSMGCRHAHLAIGEAEARHWLEHISAAMTESGVDDTSRKRLLTTLSDIAGSLVDPFLNVYNAPLPELRRMLETNPALARRNEHGRNLICNAAMHWDVPRMRLLLEFGADANEADAGGHNPLYRAANGGGRDEDGRDAIHVLLQHGADVNQITGIGGMTPLHMAARRGNIGVAEALLDAGANLEARDKNGETPLRRAVNCSQERIVRLLISRGANPISKDRFGRTPIVAARTDAVRRILMGGV